MWITCWCIMKLLCICLTFIIFTKLVVTNIMHQPFFCIIQMFKSNERTNINTDSDHSIVSSTFFPVLAKTFFS